MKRFALFPVFFVFLISFVSCGSADNIIPKSYECILEIYSGNSQNIRAGKRVVIDVMKSETGNVVKVIEPVELSGVSLSVERESATLISGDVDLVFDAESADGVFVLFEVVDMIMENNGVGLKLTEINGYKVSSEGFDDNKEYVFTVSDGSFVRTVILKNTGQTEREPAMTG